MSAIPFLDDVNQGPLIHQLHVYGAKDVVLSLNREQK